MWNNSVLLRLFFKKLHFCATRFGHARHEKASKSLKYFKTLTLTSAGTHLEFLFGGIIEIFVTTYTRILFISTYIYLVLYRIYIIYYIIRIASDKS